MVPIIVNHFHLVYLNLSSFLQENIEDEVAVIDADDSPVVIAKDADLRLRPIFPVFESGLRSLNQPITFLRPDQVQLNVTTMYTQYGLNGTGYVNPLKNQHYCTSYK